MLDLSRPVTTRDGRAVEIVGVAKTADPVYPIVCVLDGKIEQWTPKGEYLGGQEHENDLINPPEKFVLYCNVYRGCDGHIWGSTHASRDSADKAAGSGRIACIRIEDKEGQFDP